MSEDGKKIESKNCFEAYEKAIKSGKEYRGLWDELKKIYRTTEGACKNCPFSVKTC